MNWVNRGNNINVFFKISMKTVFFISLTGSIDFAEPVAQRQIKNKFTKLLIEPIKLPIVNQND